MEPQPRVAVTTYVLFLDQRELVQGGAALRELRMKALALGASPIDTRTMSITAGPVDPVEMLRQLSTIDWRHPVHVVFRTSGEDRWSHATVIGRSKGEEE